MGTWVSVVGEVARAAEELGIGYQGWGVPPRGLHPNLLVRLPTPSCLRLPIPLPAKDDGSITTCVSVW